MSPTLLLSAVLGLLWTPAVPTTIVTLGSGELQNTPTTYPSPYGSYFAGTRQQYLLLASELDSAGLLPGQPVTAISFDVLVPNPTGMPLQHFEVKMGHTAAAELITWQYNLTQVAFPSTYTESAGWNRHVLNTPFSWDGMSNLVIEVCFWNGPFISSLNGVVAQTATSHLSSRVHFSDTWPTCGTTQPGLGYPLRPDIRLTMGVSYPEFQVNRQGSCLDLDGRQGSFTTPARTRVCLDGSVPLNWMSFSALPGDLWIQDGEALPYSSTGLGTPTGQVANVDLAHPSGTWMIGHASPNTTIPFAALTLSVTATQETIASAQAYNLDAASPDGFSVSQPVVLEASATTIFAGPTGDDAFLRVRLGSEPCFAGSVLFYGTTYTELFVSSNGRVTFNGGTITAWGPPFAAAIGLPMAGAWSNLDPSAGGDICVEVSGTAIRVDYDAVPYAGQTSTATFSVVFDPQGGVGLCGLDLIEPNPTPGAVMFLGISSGNASPGGMAGDPGPTTFKPGPNPESTPGPSDMIYAYGQPGALAPGVTDIWFIWSGNGYDWFCL